MRLHKLTVFVFCLLALITSPVHAQNLVFILDSLVHGNSVAINSTYIDSFAGSSTSDSILIYTRVVNNTADTVVPSNVQYYGSLNNNLSYKITVQSQSSQTIQQFGSTYVVLKLLNSDSIIRPQIPTGSSVVIWPVYNNILADSIHFSLTYTTDSGLLAGVTDLENLYKRITTNRQIIHIVFKNTDRKTIQLYDPLDHRIYDSETDFSDVQIDWGALPASVYILRIRQGAQDDIVKLIHF
jgi:hypothetical protein